MLLLIIIGQISLRPNFYVAFCFMATETSSDYIWVLQQLRALYLQLELLNPIVIVTDMERGLMIAIRTEFPNTNHLLCLWHINNNIIVNCKKNFSIKEVWNTFFVV